MCVGGTSPPQTDPSSSDPVFFITEVLLLPFFVAVGLIGCPLILVILNRLPKRREDSSIYVYLSGLASSDLLLFCSLVPRFVHAVDALPPTVTYSRPMAYALLVSRGLGPAFRHSAVWMTALTVASCAFGVRFRGGTPTPSPSSQLTPSKWTGVRVARLLVVLVLLSCVLMNFTRFLDTEVVELTDRCYGPLTSSSLWTQNVTRLGLDATYRRVRPVVVCFLGHVIPMTATLVFVLTLACASNCCCRCRRFLLRTPKNRREHQFLVNAYVLSISISVLVLEAPSAFLAVIEACFEDLFDRSTLHRFHLVSRCLGLLRPVLGFALTALINYNFRKTCKRTCCCCCDCHRDKSLNRVIYCCHGYRKSDDDVTAKTNDVIPGNGKKTRIVVYGTKSRQPIIVDNVYDEVNSFKPNLRSKCAVDTGLWI